MRHARIPALYPNVWKKGFTTRYRSPSRRSTVRDHTSNTRSVCACVVITPFGRPVVPDVKTTSATSSGAPVGNDSGPASARNSRHGVVPAGASPRRSAVSRTRPGVVSHRRSPRSASVNERLHDLRVAIELLEDHVSGPVREAEHRLADAQRGEVLDLPGVRDRADRLHLDGLGAPAPRLVLRAQHRQRFLDPAAADRHPPVPVLRHRSEELRPALPAYEQRGPRLLHGLRPRERRLDVHELAVELGLLLGPERLHREDLLARDVAAALELDTVVLDLVLVPPEPDADSDPAAR